MRYIAIISLLVILAAPGLASAQIEERILLYQSDIEVFEDASMVVKETIKVVSTGDQIRRGIYRDFPIAYKDYLDHRYFVSFDVLEVTKNGTAEPYHIQRAGNGQRIYIGEESVSEPGEYMYSITYKTSGQLGFFDDHDELYWNVTGTGWVFPIDLATAFVKLPGNIPKDQIIATLYTGEQGSTAKNGTWSIADGSAAFATNQSLGSYEGLTIAVGWPKGIVAEPTAIQNFWTSVRANADYIVGILGFILVLIYYLYVWSARGRDPKKGIVVAQYEPPQGFSPAILRFIRRMGSDHRAMAAAIINLGVKDKLTVTENKSFLKKTYTLTKKDNSKFILTGEEKLLEDKFFEKDNTIKLEKSNASTISKIKTSFTDSLKEQVGKKYFVKNIPALVFGVIFSGIVIFAAIAASASVRYDIESILQILFWPGLIISLVVLNIVFGWLLRAYTPEGRKLVDEIEGFKLFLKVTEKDRLAFHNPPKQTPELFEKFLPYALALGVEHEWAKQFASVFTGLEQQGTAYAPLWYHGSIAHFSVDSFASSVGDSFTGVVASSSTPPGSGGGGFSGGSSGGGGGGGGGGGW